MARTPSRSLDDVRVELIEHLYAASTEPAAWHGFLDRVSHWFWGRCSIYMMPGNRGGVTRFLASNLDPAATQAHDAYYVGRRVWMVNDGPAEGLVELSESMCPEDRLIHTEYYNDWLRPNDMHHGLSCRLAVGEDTTLRFGVGRSGRYGIYDAEEQRILNSLAPHMGRAIEITRRLELLDAQARAGLSLLDQLTVGALLVEPCGRIAFANPMAERLLRAGDGVMSRHGRLHGTTPGFDARLAGAVSAAALGRGAATLPIARLRADTPLSATISPVGERDAAAVGIGPLALVLLAVPEAEARISEAAARAAFDLTPAEARLAVALCAGRTLADYASETGTSLNTVKFHLKSLFAKTGEGRQPDLIRRLMNDPGLRAPV
jgi:DNA-binding CsgD family transcriptional regulator/PAS domain-containing protein